MDTLMDLEVRTSYLINGCFDVKIVRPRQLSHPTFQELPVLAEVLKCQADLSPY